MNNNLNIKYDKIEEMIELGNNNSKKGYGGVFSALIFNSKTYEIVTMASNMVLKKNDPTAHAEIEVIRDACKILKQPNLEGYSLLASNEPCPMCMSAIMWARLDEWYFISESETAALIGFDDIEFYKRLQLIMRMKKVKSEYNKYHKYEQPILEDKLKQYFIAYKEDNKIIY